MTEARHTVQEPGKSWRWTRTVVPVILLVLAGLAAVWLLKPDPEASHPVTVPALSATAATGEAAFARHCARCHGESAAGTPVGPPLVHPVYRPGHHGDASFELAVRQGVRAHHWRFGDMPPRPEVSREEVAAITRYIRELQRANGIGQS